MAISQEILKRKGALKVTNVPADILQLLNHGLISTVNLTEWLAVDQENLCKVFFETMDKPHYFEWYKKELSKQKKPTAPLKLKLMGICLLQNSKPDEKEELLIKLSTHLSDSVRCWAAYMIGMDEKFSIVEKLKKIYPFAIDSHFGVREIAWLAVRNAVDENLNEAIKILATWAKSENEYARRFASEATRPRGVWCKHITELKINPGLGLPILEPLQSDPSKYVQDSVGNWLNDAGKTCQEWVIELCLNWKKNNSNPHTNYICKKALRNL